MRNKQEQYVPSNLAQNIRPPTPQLSRSAVYHFWQALAAPSKGLSFPRNLFCLPPPALSPHPSHSPSSSSSRPRHTNFSYYLFFMSPSLTHLIVRVHVRTRLKEDPCHHILIHNHRFMQRRASILESAPKSVPRPWGRPPPRPLRSFVPDPKLDTSTQQTRFDHVCVQKERSPPISTWANTLTGEPLELRKHSMTSFNKECSTRT